MAGRTILLVGNPNSGKTTLFNALTGLRGRVGNYPGITVEHREGSISLNGADATVVDLPGTYSLVARSDDEAVAVAGVMGQLPGTAAADLIVAVVDATALERNLYLVVQLRELNLPLLVALTMTDTLKSDGLTIDSALLSERLGVPVVRAPAVSGGAVALKAALSTMIADDTRARAALQAAQLDDWSVDVDTSAVAAQLVQRWRLPGAHGAVAQLLVSAAAAGTLDKLPLDATALKRLAPLPDTPDAAARSVAPNIIAQRSARVSAIAHGIVSCTVAEPPSVRLTRVVDSIALHTVVGPLLLVAVFMALFIALFSGAQPMMSAVESSTAWLGALVSSGVPTQMPLLRSLLVNGVIAGVGNVVVFVPQIAILFFFLAVLEDSGYLARAAFLLDRVMAKTGLHGRAFVPLLSGFACAVPAILATRTIENNKDRIVTILVTPLVSCSARLPVYTLMIATVFSTMPPLFGLVPVGAVVMVGMYVLSLSAALATAALLKRTLLRSPTPPLVLELPPYRMPSWGQVARAVWSRVRVFLVEAGTTILAITVVLWALFTFPRDSALEQSVVTRTAAAATAAQGTASGDEPIAAIEARAAQQRVRHSFAGMLGTAIEPVVAPLGYDWKLAVGIIASFAAREVLVSTLGLVYGLGDGSDENNPSLRSALRDERRSDGSLVYTPLTALSLMVFFVLAMQCMSTLSAVRRETRGWKWPAIQFGYMSLLAYVAALLVYQGGRALGFA